jgi:hypothetical protein
MEALEGVCRTKAPVQGQGARQERSSPRARFPTLLHSSARETGHERFCATGASGSRGPAPHGVYQLFEVKCEANDPVAWAENRGPFAADLRHKFLRLRARHS